MHNRFWILGGMSLTIQAAEKCALLEDKIQCKIALNLTEGDGFDSEFQPVTPNIHPQLFAVNHNFCRVE